MSDHTQIEFKSRQAIRDWLEKHHADAGTFWLVTYKKHVPDYYVPYGEIVEELLCYGWVDSRTRRVDDDRTMLLVSPRRAGSTWSSSNKKRVARLEQQGLMQEVGRKMIESAHADGSWTFLDDIERLEMPEDLAAAFKGNKPALDNYEAFNASAKKVILLWIKTAKRTATRAKRISETVRLAANNIKAAHPEAQGK